MVKLQRLEEKKVRYISHKQYLTECYRKSLIPTGFSLKWSIDLDVDQEFVSQCEAIKTDTSLKMLELTIKACENKLSDLEDEIVSTRENVWRSNGDRWDIENTLRKIRNGVHAEEKSIGLVKDRKLSTLKHKGANCSKQVTRTKPSGMPIGRVRYNRTRVRGDGNCFYRCVSTFLRGSEHEHEQVRTRVVQHLEQNADTYTCLVDGDREYHFDQQRCTDGRGTSWATEAEVFAAAAVFNLNIHITDSLEGRVEWSVHSPVIQTGGSNSVDVFLLYKGGHFDLINSAPIVSKYNSVDACAENEDIDWFDMVHVERGNIETGSEDAVLRDGCADTRQREETQNREKHISRPVRRATEDDSVCDKKSDLCMITNLSNTTLTIAQRQLLTKGLKCVPNRKQIDVVKVLSDLAEWERRMRLKEYFYGREKGEGTTETETLKCEKKKMSAFTPNQGRDVWLDAYVEVVKNDIVMNLKKTGQANLTKQE
jgi:hypothetical protein